LQNHFFSEFDIYRNMVQICHDNILSPEQYWNCMVIGSQYATNYEINVACSLLNCNIVIWVQGVDQSGNTCYTKQELIHSADGITLNLLLKKSSFPISLSHLIQPKTYK
jgi:hypothetical protein